LAILAGFVGPAAGSVAADDAGTPVEERLPPPAGFTFKGTTFCSRCHRSPQGEWCDESITATWRHDVHSRSHLALLSDNPRTRAMEQALGITAAKTAACVACHTHPAAEPPVEEEDEFVHAGISCETCHGAGSGYFEPHLSKSWRFLGSAEKEALGMRDLRDPVAKSANCLSCHLGEVETDRVISHEMYAAGHPPLPAFEMEAFSAGMGRHWKRVWQKGTRVQAAAAEAGYATEGASDLARTLVGSLATLRASARLLETYAVASLAAGESRPWPELGLYDCQACHHDLVVPSRRQQAGYGGLVPGRPGLVRWPQRAAEAAFAVAEMPTTADAVLAPWITALNARPFGRPDDLRAPPGAAESLARIDAAIAALVAVPRDGSLARRQRAIAIALADAGPRCGDLDGARVVGWMLADAVDSAAGWSDAERLAVRARLEATLGLRIAGAGVAAAEGPPFWRTSLDAAAAYDPAAVAEAFRLPAAPPPERLPPR